MSEISTRKRSPQEEFWAGEFGDEYIERNSDDAIYTANVAFFAGILRRAGRVRSVVELGANIGMNIRALRCLLPAARMAAVELNSKACARLRQIDGLTVHEQSILDFAPTETVDLAFTKGVLIHIDPTQLRRTYDRLYHSSHRLILVAEYYSPTPVDVTYRGNEGYLCKRDFAGEMLDLFGDLQLVDYGFCYRRDPAFPLDDINWFLLEKKGGQVTSGL